MARDAVPELQEPAQKRLLDAPEQRHVGELHSFAARTPAAVNRYRKDDDQHFVKVVSGGVVAALGILDPVENVLNVLHPPASFY